MRIALGLMAAAILPISWTSFGAADSGPDAKDLRVAVQRGFAFLAKTQGTDGGFSPRRAGPGITALVVTALLRNGYGHNEPVVDKALAFLEKNVQKNGGIYDKQLANYTTCVALLAFKEANKDGRYDTIIKNGTAFLKSLQDETADAKDVRFGGVGYGGKERPDLSNTQFFVDALLSSGVPKDDPAVQRALRFVSRCQNLAGEHNDQPFAQKATEDDKGGLVYNPSAADSKRDQTPEGGLRSAGAMTYAGLKSFLYAGVSKEDPRVKAAVHWIRRHFTLDQNPGMGQAGLYYYYHTFAKAMDALGEESFTDSADKAHDWRRELFEAIKKRQNPDGSWRNAADRQYGEDNADLATAFALLSISYCAKNR